MMEFEINGPVGSSTCTIKATAKTPEMMVARLSGKTALQKIAELGKRFSKEDILKAVPAMRGQFETKKASLTISGESGGIDGFFNTKSESSSSEKSFDESDYKAAIKTLNIPVEPLKEKPDYLEETVKAYYSKQDMIRDEQIKKSNSCRVSDFKTTEMDKDAANFCVGDLCIPTETIDFDFGINEETGFESSVPEEYENEELISFDIQAEKDFSPTVESEGIEYNVNNGEFSPESIEKEIEIDGKPSIEF